MLLSCPAAAREADPAGPELWRAVRDPGYERLASDFRLDLSISALTSVVPSSQPATWVLSGQFAPSEVRR
jgi:hypothetical protein